jgi:hypothetical protein
MSDIIESWKHVEGYEGIYSVSNLGRVRNERTGRVLKPGTNPTIGYHYVVLHVNGKRKNHYVHRLVAVAFVANTDPECRMQVDHIDGVRVHNLASNLRWVTRSENMMNSRGRLSFAGSTPSSKYKGVSFHKGRGKWRVSIKADGKQQHLGLFSSELEAARAYDAAALEMFGEYARLNFPSNDEQSYPV